MHLQQSRFPKRTSPTKHAFGTIIFCKRRLRQRLLVTSLDFGVFGSMGSGFGFVRGLASKERLETYQVGFVPVSMHPASTILFPMSAPTHALGATSDYELAAWQVQPSEPRQDLRHLSVAWRQGCFAPPDLGVGQARAVSSYLTVPFALE